MQNISTFVMSANHCKVPQVRLQTRKDFQAVLRVTLRR